jgi:fibronectin-binding autotransporter adhesin
MIDLAGAGGGDRIAASGDASLSGGAVDAQVSGVGVTNASRFTILTAAGGVTGNFASLQSNLTTTSDFLTPSLVYDPNDVTIAFARNSTPLASAATTPNQAAAATSLGQLGTGALYAAVTGLSAAQAPGAFNAASGEIHASAAGDAFDDSRLPREAILDRLSTPYGALGDTPREEAASEAEGYLGSAVQAAGGASNPYRVSPYSAWGQAFDKFGHIGGDSNTASLDRNLGGFVLGIDADPNPQTRFGFAGGYTQSSLTAGAADPKGSVGSIFGSLYAGEHFGQLDLEGGAIYAANRYDTTRTVAFPGFSDTDASRYGGDTMQVFGEAGWRVAFARGMLEPFGSLAAVRISTDPFTETGGAAALTGLVQASNYIATTSGLRGETQLFSSLPLMARGMLGWQHVLGAVTPTQELAFAGSATPFSITGAPIARDSIVAEAGVEWRLSGSASIGLFYSGELASRSSDNGVKGKLEVKF